MHQGYEYTLSTSHQAEMRHTASQDRLARRLRSGSREQAPVLVLAPRHRNAITRSVGGTITAIAQAGQRLISS